MRDHCIGEGVGLEPAGTQVEKGNMYFFPDSSPGCPARSLVTKNTKLRRVLHIQIKNSNRQIYHSRYSNEVPLIILYCYLMMLSVSKLYSVDDRIINEYAAVCKTRIIKGNPEKTYSNVTLSTTNPT